MNLLQKIFARPEEPELKAAPPMPGTYPGRTVVAGGWSMLPIRLPGGDRNVQADAGEVWLNDVVAAALGWITRAYGEARPETLVQAKDGSWEVDPDSEITDLLTNPNPETSGRLLRRAISWSLITDGNAYLKIERTASGRAAELWWLPPANVGFRAGQAGIQAWTYRVNGALYEYPVEDVIHLRTSLDPKNPRMGLSGLTTALRSVATDNAISRMYAALMRNMGVVPMIFSPSGEAVLEEEEQLALKAALMQNHTGEKAGEPLVSSKPISAQVISHSPDDLAMPEIRDQVTRRICAAIGIDPIVLGLSGTGETYANKASARRSAWEDRILPDLSLIGDDVGRVLIPQLGYRPATTRIAWDTSEVAALREDQDAVVERADTGVRGGWLAVNEARAMAGLPPTNDPQDDEPSRKPSTSTPNPEKDSV